MKKNCKNIILISLSAVLFAVALIFLIMALVNNKTEGNASDSSEISGEQEQEDGNENSEDSEICAHNFGSWIFTIPATCENNGVKGHYHCEKCGKNFDKDKNLLSSLEIPAKGHKFVNHSGKAPTCTEDGYSDYKTCENCDYCDKEILKAKGHNFNGGVCSNCGQLQAILNMNLSLSTDKSYYEVSGIENFTGSELVFPKEKDGKPVKVIKKNAFKDNFNIKSVVFNDNIVKIEENAFENCKNLERVTLGKNVETIFNDCFLNCVKLYTIVNKSALSIFPGDESYGKISLNAFEVVKTEEGCKIEVINDFVLYKENSDVILLKYDGRENNVIIPEKVTKIGADVFTRKHFIFEVTISSNVVEIGKNAFLNCEFLKKVTLGKNVKVIEDKAFYGCKNLKTIINKSSLKLTCGSNLSGCIGLYAENIIL